MREPTQAGSLVELGCCTLREAEGNARQQDLPGQCECHQARCHRLRQALHVHALGATRHLRGAVLPQHHFPDVDADARAQCCAADRVRVGVLPGIGMQRELATEATQHLLVFERKGRRLHRPLEQREEAIGLVDLAPVMAMQQVARQAIVLADQLGCGAVAEPLHQRGRIGEVAQQQGLHARHHRAIGARLHLLPCFVLFVHPTTPVPSDLARPRHCPPYARMLHARAR